jgi:hypothetical protein
VPAGAAVDLPREDFVRLFSFFREPAFSRIKIYVANLSNCIKFSRGQLCKRGE